ncbi:hypothetical protein ACLKA7_012195 [Drosophila subpalustris]
MTFRWSSQVGRVRLDPEPGSCLEKRTHSLLMSYAAQKVAHNRAECSESGKHDDVSVSLDIPFGIGGFSCCGWSQYENVASAP